MRVLIAFLFCFVFSFQFIYAEKKTYTTQKISGEPPNIDGLINETVWDLVEWDGGFVQIQPYENKPPSQQTEFKVLYDDNNLYFAIRAYDTAPDSIEKRMSRRDGFEGDWVEVNIDSYHDLRTAFSFTITASGVKGDEAISNDGDNWDSNWDPIWYVKTSIDAKGWIAEMKIPFSQLRFGKQDVYTWGLQVNRRFFRKEERSSWQFISPNASGWVHLFGELHGIKGIKPQKQKD
ncbi:MAG: carbohydrate binding family 9 domain-containing protein, partial [Bacteroidales bacterium]|nr:carbohydrate binding family 9 domain-containing protein [Bacteroidales bacterium]